MSTADLVEKIRLLILKETKYLGTYTATVVDNSIGNGILRLSCFELGWDDESSYCNARSRDEVSRRILPEIGDIVELGFTAGKSEYPYWGRLLNDIDQATPEQYTSELSRIIFEDRRTGDFIKYDAGTKKFEINIGGDVFSYDSTARKWLISASSTIELASTGTMNITSTGTMNITSTGTMNISGSNVNVSGTFNVNSGNLTVDT